VKFLQHPGRAILCLAFFILTCCQSRNDTQTEDVVAYDTVENLTDTLGHVAGDGVEFVECPRGTPERVIKASVVPQPSFELNKEKNLATETLQFQNGDRLVVKNGGCEYFVVTFRFETNRFKADTTDMLYWLDKSAVLVSEITEAIDAPLDFNDGISAIRKMNGPEVKYDLGQEIVYADGDIRKFATLDRVQQIDPARYAVEVTFALGPF
jgi:hypothetical protein